MLEIKNLAVGSGQLSHTFLPGRISVLLGNNGSGKSTLTRLISGLSPVRNGNILLDQSNITHLPVVKRDVALVFQDFVNYPSLNCFENIASPMRAQNFDADSIQNQVHKLADTLKLREFLHRLPDALSGGQQQRLAIARALAKQSSVLLLDEPLVNLDYKLRETLLVELKQLLHERNCTVIYTSSDTNEAFAVADELILFDRGNILQAGEPIQLMKHPASIECADLMADPGINRLRGLVYEGVLSLGHPDSADNSAASLFAVRPDHLHLAPISQDYVQLAALNKFSESNGSDTYLHFSPSFKKPVNEPVGAPSSREVNWVAHLPGHHHFIPGEITELYIATQDLKQF